jgi:hypothetical protein
MANMLNNPEAISQAMSMITPEMMDQVSPVRSDHVVVVCDTDVTLDSLHLPFISFSFATFAFTWLSSSSTHLTLGYTLRLTS